MRLPNRLYCVVCGVLLAQVGVCAADAPEQALVISAGADPKEVRDYKVTVTTTGRVPVESTGEIREENTVYTLTVRHEYGRRENDGLLPLEISVVEGEINLQGQRFAVESNIFPNLTILLDRDWRVDRVFGIAGTRYEESRPGLNYGNLIILFFLYGADQPRKAGDTWHFDVRLPCYPETYGFNTSLESFDSESARVHQEISWASRGHSIVSRADSKCIADSKVALRHGKLLESHAECEIVFLGKGGSSENETVSSGTGQDRELCRANVRIDILLAQ